MKSRFAFSLLMGGCALVAMAQGGYQDGVDYYNADRYNEAKIILDKTLGDASTDKGVAYYYLGAIDLRSGNKAAAEANFTKGREANPACGLNYVGLGEIALLNGDKKAASDLFKEAMKIDKKNYEITTAVARAYFNVDPVLYSKDIEKYVAQALKESANMGPDVYVLKGDMAAAANDINNAAAFYDQAMEYSTSGGRVNPEAYVKYANLYRKVSPAYAINRLIDLRKAAPTSALAQRELAEKYYDAQEFSKAAAEYKEYMNNPNHFQQDEQRYSQLLYFDNKNQESLAIAKNVLSQDPGNFYMYRMVMLNDAALGNNEEACEYGAKLFSTKDVTLTATDYNTYGSVLAKAGRPTEAVAVYEQAYNSDPEKFSSMLVNLSDLYTELSDYKKATEYLNRYVEGGNGSLTDRFNLAKLYGALAQTSPEDSPERADALSKGVAAIDLVLETAGTKAPLYRTKGQMLGLRDGNTISDDQAATYKAMLEAYAQEQPDAATANPGPFKQAYSVLGTYYKQKGDEAESTAWFERLYELDPTIPGLKEMLKK